MTTARVMRSGSVSYVAIGKDCTGREVIRTFHDNGTRGFISEIPKDAKPCALWSDNGGITPTHVRDMIASHVENAIKLGKKST